MFFVYLHIEISGEELLNSLGKKVKSLQLQSARCCSVGFKSFRDLTLLAKYEAIHFTSELLALFSHKGASLSFTLEGDKILISCPGTWECGNKGHLLYSVEMS